MYTRLLKAFLSPAARRNAHQRLLVGVTVYVPSDSVASASPHAAIFPK